MTQTEIEHLTNKSTLYKLNTYPRGPNFGLSWSTISGFQDTRSPNRKYTEWSQTEIEHLILICFSLRPAVSKISHIL